MATVQFICAKIAMVSGQGLAAVLRQHTPRAVLYPAVIALVVANTLNAGVDIGAIAAGLELLTPLPAGVWVLPVAGTIAALQIWGSYRVIAATFKWLTLALFAYVGASIMAEPPAGEVLRATFLPRLRFDTATILLLVAILGTTISPYLFFWQATQEVEEKVEQGRVRLAERRGTNERQLHERRWDVLAGMLFSNAVMYCIMLATASTLFRSGPSEIRSAAEAAEALRPFAGAHATWLFALGLVGTGFLAVPILTGSAAYALAEIFGWRRGLNRRPHQAPEFYVAIVLSTMVGAAIHVADLNPMVALVWMAVLNGLLAPPLLALIMRIADDRRIMGTHVNGHWTRIVGWGTVGVMTAAAVALLVTWGQS
jgi:Mn2+/Fe2+ NRAMP family transporter